MPVSIVFGAPAPARVVVGVPELGRPKRKRSREERSSRDRTIPATVRDSTSRAQSPGYFETAWRHVLWGGSLLSAVLEAGRDPGATAFGGAPHRVSPDVAEEHADFRRLADAHLRPDARFNFEYECEEYGGRYRVFENVPLGRTGKRANVYVSEGAPFFCAGRPCRLVATARDLPCAP